MSHFQLCNLKLGWLISGPYSPGGLCVSKFLGETVLCELKGMNENILDVQLVFVICALCTLIVRLFFFWNFWGTFCVVFHQNQGKKCPKTFGFGQPPPFSTQNSKIVGAQKVPQNFLQECEKVNRIGPNNKVKSCKTNISKFHKISQYFKTSKQYL